MEYIYSNRSSCQGLTIIPMPFHRSHTPEAKEVNQYSIVQTTNGKCINEAPSPAEGFTPAASHALPVATEDF